MLEGIPRYMSFTERTNTSRFEDVRASVVNLRFKRVDFEVKILEPLYKNRFTINFETQSEVEREFQPTKYQSVQNQLNMITRLDFQIDKDLLSQEFMLEKHENNELFF